MHLTDAQQLAKEKPIDIAFVCMKSYDTAWATTMIRQYLAPGRLHRLAAELHERGDDRRRRRLGQDGGLHRQFDHRRSVRAGPVRRAAGKSGVEAHRVPHRRGARPRHRPGQGDLPAWSAYADSAMVTENLWGERWSKLVTNVMGNGLSACTGLIGSEMVQNDAIRHFSARLGSEAIRVGQALGYDAGGDPATWIPEIIARAGEGDAGGDAAHTTSTAWPR